MQLLDLPHNQLSATMSDRLQHELQDIVQNVQIQSGFGIKHPNYKPLELPTEAIDRFQNLPSALQEKYLSLQLRGFLYGIYYNGSLRTTLDPTTDTETKSLHQDLENNTFLGVDLAFYDQLHQSNSGEGYFDSGWQVLRQESDGSLAVAKGGLTLHINRDRHLKSPNQPATIGTLVAIRLPRNLVQNGFYMAVGNAGTGREEVVRVYCNLSPEGAIAVMHDLTSQINAANIPFSFKALYNPSDYGRYDSAVLYFQKHRYEAIRVILQQVYDTNQAYFQSSVPLFTKMIAPGLAIAEEPNQKFAEQESFGMHRCQIVTNGLLEAWHQGKESPEERMAAIIQHFSLLGIALQRPYLNANSTDIYTPLDL